MKPLMVFLKHDCLIKLEKLKTGLIGCWAAHSSIIVFIFHIQSSLWHYFKERHCVGVKFANDINVKIGPKLHHFPKG